MGNNVKMNLRKGAQAAIEIRLPYGTGEALVTVPDSQKIDFIQYRYAPDPGLDQEAIIRDALAAPVGTATLSELAKNRNSAVILISDISRLCPSAVFLPAILTELNRGGVADDNIQIIVALGMHRKQTRSELGRLVGPDVLARVRVHNHSALPEDCVLVGQSSRGTPIEINRSVAQADLIVATGNIEPHSLAGMSGGSKALLPGVASQRCIEANHSLSQQHPIHPGDPDNPIRLDMEETLRFVPVHFLFNVIVNHRREVMAAVAGHPVSAHRVGVRYARDLFLVNVERSYDVVLASTGGYPKDMQLYQAIKTIVNASHITKPGGSILLAARCEELFGNGMFQLWVETIQDRTRMVEKLKQQFVLGAHKVEHVDHVLSKHNVYLFSDIPDPTVELLGFHPVSDLQISVRDLISGDQGSLAVACMPYGAITFPVTQSPG